MQEEKSKSRAGRATSNVFAKMSKKLMQEMKEVGWADNDLCHVVSKVLAFLFLPGD